MKPKASVPLKRIVSVSEIKDEDKKKFKKLAKAADVAFKVTFTKMYIVNHEYVPGQGDSDLGSDQDEPEEEK